MQAENGRTEQSREGQKWLTRLIGVSRFLPLSTVAKHSKRGNKVSNHPPGSLFWVYYKEVGDYVNNERHHFVIYEQEKAKYIDGKAKRNYEFIQKLLHG